MDKFSSKDNISRISIIGQFLFWIAVILLFITAYPVYKGEGYIYLLFTVLSHLLLYLGFRKNAIFFDTFIGIFLWLGFWLKFSIRIAFMDGQFPVTAIGAFDNSAAEFDLALLVSSCGFLGLIVASYLREKYWFVYPSKITEVKQQGLFELFKQYRKVILFLFVVFFLAVALLNFYFGIYQRGTISETNLPFGLNGVFKWLLLFGLASFSAILLRFEYITKNTTSYLVAIVALLEAFVSNVSLLSRGMILNVSGLMYGVFKGFKLHGIKVKLRFIVVCGVIFIILFGSSVFAVNYMRASNFSDDPTNFSNSDLLSKTSRSTSRLFLDRWVGIEGVMSVSSYQEKGWHLWKQAWQEKYVGSGTSYYDTHLITSPYNKKDMTKHHFISLPGIIAFCFYPGSFIFLFLCMVLVSVFASAIEILIFKLGGMNVILCSLLAQVMAFRFASFGYVPAQSYLLFGTIVISIALICFFDKLLTIWSKD